jgi:hypothetical protein
VLTTCRPERVTQRYSCFDGISHELGVAHTACSQNLTGPKAAELAPGGETRQGEIMARVEVVKDEF